DYEGEAAKIALRRLGLNNRHSLYLRKNRARDDALVKEEATSRSAEYKPVLGGVGLRHRDHRRRGRAVFINGQNLIITRPHNTNAERIGGRVGNRANPQSAGICQDAAEGTPVVHSQPS